MKKLSKLSLCLAIFIMAISLFAPEYVSAGTRYIKTAKELKTLKNARQGDVYILKKDIDLKNISDWKPFDFSGKLDGRGHAIKNLTGTKGGLFDNLTYGAEISNLRLTNISIDTLKNLDTMSMIINIGGLANTSQGASITKCSVSGRIDSTAVTGGFVGKAEDTEIKTCVSSIYLDTGSIAGGLVGEGRGNMLIEDCLMIGRISKKSAAAVGGMAGEFFGTLKRCVTASGVIDTESSSNNKGSIIGVVKGDAHISDCYYYGNVPALGPENKEYKSLVHLDEKSNKSIMTGLNFKVWTLKKKKNNGVPVLKWYLKYLH